MNWFDEAIARKQREQRVNTTEQEKQISVPVDPAQTQRQEIDAFNPLLTRLLNEYGERAYGKSFFQKRFQVQLEHPGKSLKKQWGWHWHIYSFVKDVASVEVHPNFDEKGIISSFLLLSGFKRVETTSTDELELKEALVSLFLQK